MQKRTLRWIPSQLAMVAILISMTTCLGVAESGVDFDATFKGDAHYQEGCEGNSCGLYTTASGSMASNLGKGRLTLHSYWSSLPLENWHKAHLEFDDGSTLSLDTRMCGSNPPGVVCWFKITGGTGRFATAQGSVHAAYFMVTYGWWYYSAGNLAGKLSFAE